MAELEPYAITLADGSMHIQRVKVGEGNLERVLQAWYPNGEAVKVEKLDPAQIPEDRSFRNAWRHCSKNGVRHCMETARNIQRDKMREVRAKRLLETDAVFMQAISSGRDASAVAEMKQALRDVTKDPAIEAAQTPEELKAVWPDVLDQPVPAIGAVRLSDAVDPAVTKSLTDWANGLEDRLAKVEVQTATSPINSSVDLGPIAEELARLQHAVKAGATMKDVQGLAAVLDAVAQRLAAMETRQTLQDGRLKEAAARVDFVMKEGAGQAELTSEELTQ